MATDKIRRAYRIRIALFLSCALLGVALLSIAYQAVQTLVQLDAVEHERDQWQRPSDVLQWLNVSAGNVVADLGCGSGYFALKLSPIVGPSGRVLALDIRRMSLCFLWIRTVLRHDHNISVTHTQPDNHGLPTGAVDAVLIANTYHELTHPTAILQRIFISLRLDGRLVVLDRGPESAYGEIRGIETHHHALPLDLAEKEIRQSGFEIISQQDHFIDGPGHEPWWLIVARKP
jgi:ubiquinone/menaquinone biosynthesis C-methylase UbiE